MNPILEIVSVRVKNLHIEPLSGEVTKHDSINKAKARSRQLGGAGKVRALSQEGFKAFRKDYLCNHWTEEVNKATGLVKLAWLNCEAAVQEWEGEEDPTKKIELEEERVACFAKHDRLCDKLKEVYEELKKVKELQS